MCLDLLGSHLGSFLSLFMWLFRGVCIQKCSENPWFFLRFMLQLLFGIISASEASFGVISLPLDQYSSSMEFKLVFRKGSDTIHSKMLKLIPKMCKNVKQKMFQFSFKMRSPP